MDRITHDIPAGICRGLDQKYSTGDLVRSFCIKLVSDSDFTIKDSPVIRILYLKIPNDVFFVNGCFWHRHEGCKYSYTLMSVKNFWLNKFASTVERDYIKRTTINQLVGMS